MIGTRNLERNHPSEDGPAFRARGHGAPQTARRCGPRPRDSGTAHCGQGPLRIRKTQKNAEATEPPERARSVWTGRRIKIGCAHSSFTISVGLTLWYSVYHAMRRTTTSSAMRATDADISTGTRERLGAPPIHIRPTVSHCADNDVLEVGFRFRFVMQGARFKTYRGCKKMKSQRNIGPCRAFL